MWSSKDGVKKQTMAWSTKWTPQGSGHSAHSHLEWTQGHISWQAQGKTLVCSTLNQCIVHKVYASRNNPTRAQEWQYINQNAEHLD